MAKLKNYLLHGFDENPDKPRVSVEVPFGSRLLECKPVPQGIMVWYEVPTIDTEMTRWDHYKILGRTGEIPPDSEFVAIIDVVIPGPDGDDKLIIMPVYKLL
jgi:hypothetical protein